MSDRTCSVDGCDSPVLARGWCSKHYARWRARGDVQDRTPVAKGQCLVEGCDKQDKTRGWCVMHYSRFLRHGSTADPASSPKPPCSVDSCERPSKSRGLCNMHYLRLLRRGSTDDPCRTNAGRACSVERCDAEAKSRGLCGKHYWRLKTFGDAKAPWDDVPWGLKWCWRCEVARPLAEFYVGAKGPESPCKACRSATDKVRRRNRPARTRPSRNRKRRALLRIAKVERYTALEIATRDGWFCQICLNKGLSRTKARIGKTYRFPHPRSLSIDHIIPISRGGDDVKTNVQAAHFTCNASKRDGGADQLRLIG